MLHQGI